MCRLCRSFPSTQDGAGGGDEDEGEDEEEAAWKPSRRAPAPKAEPAEAAEATAEVEQLNWLQCVACEKWRTVSKEVRYAAGGQRQRPALLYLALSCSAWRAKSGAPFQKRCAGWNKL